MKEKTDEREERILKLKADIGDQYLIIEAANQMMVNAKQRIGEDLKELSVLQPVDKSHE